MKQQNIEHLTILGGGSAAFAAAIKAKELGVRVTLINDGLPIGGTCVNVGCIPSKALFATAKQVHHSQHPTATGVNSVQPVFSAAESSKSRMQLVQQLRQAKYEDILATLPTISVIQDRAVFREDGSLWVGSRCIQTDRVLIATGSRPYIPPMEDLMNTPYWTSTEALEATSLPESLLVWGAGFIGVELAQAFSRLGVRVTILARTSLLSSHDPSLGEAIHELLVRENVVIVEQAHVESIHYQNKNFELYGKFGAQERIIGKQLLVATGRTPNTNAMGLEHVNVALDSNGQILVDAKLQTSNPSIFAAGDATTLPKFVYVAALSGAIAAENALYTPCCRRDMDLSIVPDVVFTEPQIASVGLSLKAAQAQGITVVTSTIPMKYVPRAIVEGRMDGFVTLLADQQTKKLLGAYIIADAAGEMIQTIAIAIQQSMTYENLTSVFFPYLTYVEAIKLAAQGFTKDVTKLSCCAS